MLTSPDTAAGTSRQESAGMAVEEIIDELYGMPLSEFTQARNQAADELRKAGRPEEAARVKALRKPTAAAAAVNRVVREHGREVEQFLRSAALLRDAQFAGKGDMAAATSRERDALERLIRAGGETIRQTLLAAAVDEDAADQLLQARLERELEPRGFGTLLAHAPPTAPKAKTTGASQEQRSSAMKRKPGDRAARAKLQDAKTQLTAAEAEERQARRRWSQTQKQVEQAHATLDKAQRDLQRLQNG